MLTRDAFPVMRPALLWLGQAKVSAGPKLLQTNASYSHTHLKRQRSNTSLAAESRPAGPPREISNSFAAMSPTSLPATITVAAFDALHDEPAAWREVIASIAAGYSAEPVRQMAESTVLVALLGCEQVVKLYPPFLRDHYNFECAALTALEGRLSVPTPRRLATGEREGWPYLVMSQLAGVGLVAVWPTLSEAERCALLGRLGALVAEVHALPAHSLRPHAPTWPSFIQGQRQHCHARQQRTGLPPHLLHQLDEFLQGDLPTGPDVILTGEYTPMNLLVQGPTLVGMFDFGDGLVGPREYDWLGPLTFLAAGSAARCQAFFAGYGVVADAAQRLALMRLLLLHRYSHLPAQIASLGWQHAQSFEELTALIWP
jgi:hygromycin-B 7''-O-kinase